MRLVYESCQAFYRRTGMPGARFGTKKRTQRSPRTKGRTGRLQVVPLLYVDKTHARCRVLSIAAPDLILWQDCRCCDGSVSARWLSLIIVNAPKAFGEIAMSISLVGLTLHVSDVERSL